MNLSEANRVHMIGVGGIGMSALARLFLHEGKQVSGSDRAPSDITRALEREGLLFYPEQKAENITDGIELIVYTEAMAGDHPEMAAAGALGVPMMNYFEALGTVANEYYLVAVAGSHGKTTTTAMLIDIFESAGLDPTAVVGSLRAKTGSNFRAGKSKYMIVEACEYRRDFLHLRPTVLVITNIEHEHVDYYKTLADVQKAFREFAETIPKDGAVVANLADANVRPVVEGLSCEIVDYGKSLDPTLMLPQPGLHNQMNAAAATAAAGFCGIKPEAAKETLKDFSGTWRRFEYKGEVNGAKVHDDYGHHPTEIRATLAGAREWYPDKKITIVFQPHMYSRLHELFDDFAAELARADAVILAPVYAAREANESGVSSEKLAAAIRDKGGDARFIETFDEIVDILQQTATADDVILVMGAGDITSVAEALTA
jgi:UDP-N-acetylmuramate--alanine ligase